jgi:hypothetical protein
MKIDDILTEVKQEILSATCLNGRFTSRHEGIALIREEYLELEHEIFQKSPDRQNMRKEAIQVAAMAIRLIMDCIDF